MRITYLVREYPPAIAGSTNFMAAAAEWATAQGHHTRVVCRDTINKDGIYRPLREQREGVQVERFAQGRLARRIAKRLWLPRLQRRDPLFFEGVKPEYVPFRKAAVREPADLVHTCAIPTEPVRVGASLAESGGIASVVNPFFHLSLDDYYDARARWARVLNAYDRVLPATEVERGFFEEQGIASEKLTVLPVPVRPLPQLPVEQTRAWLEAKGVRAERVVMSSTAAPYARAKGIADLVDAARLLPAVAFLVIGGTERGIARLRTDLGDTPPPNLQLLGFLDEREKVLAFNACDVFALPSRTESFGIVYVEAQSLGKPVVAAQSEVMREVCGEAASFVEFGAGEELAKSLHELLEQPACYARASEAATANARRFRPDVVFPRLGEVYDAALNRRRGPI